MNLNPFLLTIHSSSASLSRAIGIVSTVVGLILIVLIIFCIKVYRARQLHRADRQAITQGQLQSTAKNHSRKLSTQKISNIKANNSDSENSEHQSLRQTNIDNNKFEDGTIKVRGVTIIEEPSNISIVTDDQHSNANSNDTTLTSSPINVADTRKNNKTQLAVSNAVRRALATAFRALPFNSYFYDPSRCANGKHDGKDKGDNKKTDTDKRVSLQVESPGETPPKLGAFHQLDGAHGGHDAVPVQGPTIVVRNSASYPSSNKLGRRGGDSTASQCLIDANDVNINFTISGVTGKDGHGPFSRSVSDSDIDLSSSSENSHDYNFGCKEKQTTTFVTKSSENMNATKEMNGANRGHTLGVTVDDELNLPMHVNDHIHDDDCCSSDVDADDDEDEEDDDDDNLTLGIKLIVNDEDEAADDDVPADDAARSAADHTDMGSSGRGVTVMTSEPHTDDDVCVSQTIDLTVRGYQIRAPVTMKTSDVASKMHHQDNSSTSIVAQASRLQAQSEQKEISVSDNEDDNNNGGQEILP